MEKRSLLYPLLIFGGLLVACFVFALVLFKSVGGQAGESPYAWTRGEGPKIGIVDISGVIKDSTSTLSQLIRFRRDKDIRAIVVRIDSPGGAVAPSQAIYREILRTRKDKKVVVSMGTVAASGGYYIASAADRIYAMPGTITGSIGVISEFASVEKLLDFARIETTTIKSGAMKDIGSPLRAMTPDEKQFVQGFVNDIYEQFLSDVSTARHLDKEKLRKIADGRILSGEQAKKAGLIDEIGNLEEAVDGAAKLAGATGEPVPVFARPKKSVLSQLMEDSAESAAGGLGRAVSEMVGGGETVEARDPRLR